MPKDFCCLVNGDFGEGKIVSIAIKILLAKLGLFLQAEIMAMLRFCQAITVYLSHIFPNHHLSLKILCTQPSGICGALDGFGGTDTITSAISVSSLICATCGF